MLAHLRNCSPSVNPYRDKPVTTTVFLVVAILCVGLNSAYALTCASPSFTLSEAYDAADAIVVAVITECAKKSSSGVYTAGDSGCFFVSTEVLKDASANDDIRGEVSTSACGLSYRVGEEYLLFLDSAKKPLRFSSSLAESSASIVQSKSYVQTLRDYRRGAIGDLSEPWVFAEKNATCWLSHSVARISLTFTGPSLEYDDDQWHKEIVDNNLVLSGKAQSVGLDGLPDGGEYDVRIVSDSSEPPGGELSFAVALNEFTQKTLPRRHATIDAGNKTWELIRNEVTVSFMDQHEVTQASYMLHDDEAADLLETLSRPTDVVVTATLIVASSSKEKTGEHPTQDVGSEPRSIRPQAGIVSPVPDSVGVGGARSQPESTLTLNTRSTQIQPAITEFQDCLTRRRR